MIAKCLQNLANLVEFGVKESYMEVVNPFILKNKERMVVFLDHLSVSNTYHPPLSLFLLKLLFLISLFVSLNYTIVSYYYNFRVLEKNLIQTKKE